MRRSSFATLAAALVAACGRDTGTPVPPAVSFVQVTDPHLFLQRTYTATGNETDSARRAFQERLDREAMRAFLSAAGSLPGDERPQFILVTGDWGIDTTTSRPPPPPVAGQPPATPPRTDSVAAARRWAEQADSVAAILNASPVKQVYWVPGNNDIAKERADTASLAVADAFTGLVSRRLRNGVTLQNLTGCYAGQPGACTADVAGTRYTLLGVPTVSFKNADTATAAANRPLQDAVLSQAESLLAGQAARERRVLVATHVPELDDPYVMGLQRFAGAAPHRATLGASAWDVSDSALARWKRIVESPSVAAVLAGHFHDSHREIYAAPYAWAESSPLRASPAKLILAPPLSVKNQESSPVQARGFVLIRLTPDSVQRRVYWLDPLHGRFVGEARSRRVARGPGIGIDAFGKGLGWLWHLTEREVDLARAAVWSFALLAALLTTVALWRIPAPVPPPPPTAGAAPPAASVAAQQSALGSAFEGNFARTILSGLGGMAAVAFLDSFWEKSGFNAKAYYVVLFIAFLLVFLLAFAMLRGFAEALRSRIVVPRYVVQWRPPTRPGGPAGGGGGGGGDGGGRGAGPSRWAWAGWGVRYAWSWSWFQLRRLWRWILSLREAVFVFFDTALNYLAGRNQFVSEIWENKIIAIQETIVEAAERLRDRLNITARDALGRQIAREVKSPDEVAAAMAKLATVAQGVRVAITALADDGKSLFYIAPAPESLAQPFPIQSVAWVAVQSGEARWWLKSFTDQDVVLYDNTSESIPVAKGKLPLKEYYATRRRSDYGAFVVIPIPWHRNDADLRRGAIHISFTDERWFRQLWPELWREADSDEPFRSWETLLTPGVLIDEPLRVALHQAADVLAELLAQFDQTIFERLCRKGTHK